MAIGEQREKEAKANLIPKVTANADYKYFANLPYQLLPCLLYTSPSPRDRTRSRMPSSA